MRSVQHLVTLLLVLPLAFTVIAPFENFSSSPHTRPLGYSPAHRHASRTQRYMGLLRQLRDRVTRLVWNVRHDENHSAHVKSNMAITGPLVSVPRITLEDVVLRFRIESEAEAAALADAVTILMLDVWEFTAEWVDIRLSERVLPLLLGLLPESLQEAHTPLMDDLAAAILDSYPVPLTERPKNSILGAHGESYTTPQAEAGETHLLFRNYQPFSVLVRWMKLLAAVFRTHVRMIRVGVSYEGREIYALRVGVHPTNSERPLPPRKTIIISAGSHAREWISTSTVAYVAYSFITEYGKNAAVTRLVEKFDWIFILTLNPDGYVFTWDNDRLWRKNRQETGIRFCKGIDLDRSYGFEWANNPDRDNPCSESFSGEQAFEAFESRSFANWVQNETAHERAEVVGFLDLHSYSQQVLYPYSYSCTASPPSLENLEELAMGLAKAIRLTNGVKYGVTSACEGSVFVGDGKPPARHDGSNRWPRMESGGGSALDWFYHEMGVRYAYQIKLRDTGSYGFLLPSTLIVPTGKEALNAVQYFGNFLLGDKAIEVDEGDDLDPEEGKDEDDEDDENDDDEEDEDDEDDEDEDSECPDENAIDEEEDDGAQISNSLTDNTTTTTKNTTTNDQYQPNQEL